MTFYDYWGHTSFYEKSSELLYSYIALIWLKLEQRLFLRKSININLYNNSFINECATKGSLVALKYFSEMQKNVCS